MKHGFFKVAAATPIIKTADPSFNAENIIKMMEKAEKKGVKVLLFPELSLTGYTCNDLFFQSTLRKSTIDALDKIREKTKETGTVTIVGLPLEKNAKLYNTAVFLYKGEILGVVPKTYIPNYGEFYECRHFTPAPCENSVISIGEESYPFGTKMIYASKESPELKIACEICEDLWVPAPPSIGHAMAGATIIVNPSASDELIGKKEYRRSLVSSQSSRLLAAYMYADAGYGESTQDMVFAGHNIIAENGSVLSESRLFENEMIITEVDLDKLSNERMRQNTFTANDEGYETIYFSMPLTNTRLTRKVEKRPFVPEDEGRRKERCETILEIQSEGLKKRIEHTNSKTAVIGISGGLDSSLALLVTVRAFRKLNRPMTDILAVTMPCFGTTKRTKSNAERLCEAIGTSFMTVDIKNTVTSHFKDIGHDINNLNVVYENGQARERTKVLMDLANEKGGMVIGTGDLSELALGWATYNGDHMSMYAVNASVPKTLVRHIVKYVADTAENEKMKESLYDILATPVSPELLPAKDGEISQKTEELVGPYDLHDFYLYHMVRFGFSPEKILRLAEYAFGDEYDEATVKFWLKTFIRRFFSQQFKRSCLPDGPKVGTVTLSPRGDWRMPSDASVKAWISEAEKL